MIRVVVAGNFFPLHDGHIDHLEKARKLGSYLIVIIGSDEYLRMRNKPVFLSLENRKKQLRAWTDEVIEVVDKDGTCAKTLEMVRNFFPNDKLKFAKGGDRTPDNMPENEIKVCEELGIQIEYGVGDQLNSSSELVRRIRGGENEQTTSYPKN